MRASSFGPVEEMAILISFSPLVSIFVQGQMVTGNIQTN